MRALRRLGFEEAGHRGSHVRLRRHSQPGVVVVPVHRGKVIGPGLLAAILDQAGVSVEEMRDAL